MILCDTNILIEFFKDNLTVKEALAAIGQGEIAICWANMSSVTV